jgi:hypothetical protein
MAKHEKQSRKIMRRQLKRQNGQQARRDSTGECNHFTVNPVSNHESETKRMPILTCTVDVSYDSSLLSITARMYVGQKEISCMRCTGYNLYNHQHSTIE